MFNHLFSFKKIMTATALGLAYSVARKKLWASSSITPNAEKPGNEAS